MMNSTKFSFNERAASNLGYRVINNKVLDPKGAEMQLKFDSVGYYIFYPNFPFLSGQDRSKSIPVHRLAAYQKYGELLYRKGHIVVFKDGDKTNLAESNLRITNRRELSHFSPMDSRVAEMYKLRTEKKYTYQQIANSLGVNKSTVYSALHRKYTAAQLLVLSKKHPKAEDLQQKRKKREENEIQRGKGIKENSFLEITDTTKGMLFTKYERLANNLGYRVVGKEVFAPDGGIIPLSDYRQYATGYLITIIDTDNTEKMVALHRLVAYQKYGDAMYERGRCVKYINKNHLDFTENNIYLAAHVRSKSPIIQQETKKELPVKVPVQKALNDIDEIISKIDTQINEIDWTKVPIEELLRIKSILIKQKE